ncbi:hypothetical protein BH09DEP1_BH09DEP1_8370 [soil metagenome]
MKRSSFIAVFALSNLAMVLLHIHKHSKIIELSFTKQKIETQKVALFKQKQQLTHHLQALHNLRDVQQFALKELALKPAKITQVKKITNDQII